MCDLITERTFHIREKVIFPFYPAEQHDGCLEVLKFCCSKGKKTQKAESKLE